jgi:predicted O-methyltransferase YrrM
LLPGRARISLLKSRRAEAWLGPATAMNSKPVLPMKNPVCIAVSLFLLLAASTRLEAQPDPGRRPPERSGVEALMSSQTIPKNEREKKILAVLSDMDQTQRRGSMSVPVNDGRLLRILAESTGAKHVVELGTSIGYSGLWFCLGLEHTGGKLTTFEIDEGRAATARANFKRAEVEARVNLVFGDAHEKVSSVGSPVDIVFLDADKEGYLDYLEKLLPKLRPGGLVIAHNMNERQADPRYVKAITTNPELETLFLNAGASGIAVSMKKR